MLGPLLTDMLLFCSLLVAAGWIRESIRQPRPAADGVPPAGPTGVLRTTFSLPNPRTN